MAAANGRHERAADDRANARNSLQAFERGLRKTGVFGLLNLSHFASLPNFSEKRLFNPSI